MAPLGLFYCYAHEDETLRDELEKHLRQLQRQGFIASWHDRKILPGGSFADEIEKHLQTASIILLLVSPDFLASDVCYEAQMQRALERHWRGDARVIPIILRPCDWQHAPLGDLQCLPRSGNPIAVWESVDAAFLDVTKGLRKLIEQQQGLVRPPLALSPQDRQNRLRLLKQVRRIWIDGLLKRSLHGAVRIELYLQDRPDVLDNPWRLQVQELSQAPQVLPDGTTIVEVYDRAEGELLILGEPGSGKTTLLLELAHTLLERAGKDEQLRMPIVFHLSSWAEKRQPLHTWLSEELCMKYQVPRKIGHAWIDTDQVLPLLDGLDEVAKDARLACVEQINAYYQSQLECGRSPFVICCRSQEYAELSTHVRLSQAVSILPLSDEQITASLEQLGEQGEALRQWLSEDAELHRLVHQPLMLNIFTLAYQGERPSEVPIGQTREEMQHTIFAAYIERMLKRREQLEQPEQIIHWLTFLAEQMQQHDQTLFSVEKLQATWLTKRYRLLYRCCMGLIGGMIPLPVALAFGLAFGLAAGSGAELVAGLTLGLIFGLHTDINPAEVFTWSWKKALLWLVGGLVAGLVPGLVGAMMKGSVFGLVAGVIGMVIGGLFFGLVGGLSSRQLPERLCLSANEGIWRSGKNGFVAGLVFGIVVGLALGLVAGLFKGLIFGLVFGLVVALVAAIVAGLAKGLEDFVKHFLLRYLLTQQGDVPWNLVPCLDEAVQRLLLRKVGGSYIFVHRLLQEYFAGLGEKTGSRGEGTAR